MLNEFQAVRLPSVRELAHTPGAVKVVKDYWPEQRFAVNGSRKVETCSEAIEASADCGDLPESDDD